MMDPDRWTTEQVRAEFSGIVMIVQDGEVTHKQVYQSAAGGSPLGIDSAFYISSITKTMTALAIAQLAERQLLGFGDPISRYLREIKKEKAEITIHQLLTHSSGLSNHYAAEGISDMHDATQAILEPQLICPPGTMFQYSNDGYMLLAILLTVVSGKQYEVYLRENLFAPAGMTKTGFWGEESPNLVAHPVLSEELVSPNWGFRGSTGVFTTVDDLYKWNIALANDVLISDATRSTVFSPHVLRTERQAYGYGWQIIQLNNEARLVMHAGVDDLLGHNAVFYRTVDGQTAIIMLAGCAEETFVSLHRRVAQDIFT